MWTKLKLMTVVILVARDANEAEVGSGGVWSQAVEFVLVRLARRCYVFSMRFAGVIAIS
jgi:hypothetical protein